jgi:thiol-disulfide isomerase/thioredoxin
MKLIRYNLVAALLLCVSNFGLFGQGLKLTVTIPDLPDSELILSHRMGLKFYTDDTVKTDNNGKAVFESSAHVTGGMYQIVLPNKKFIEFFLDKNQVFGIISRASTPAESLVFTGSPENERFHEWQNNFSANKNRSSLIQAKIKKGNLPADSLSLLNRELQDIQYENNKLWDLAIQDLAGTLPGSFIKGMKPVRIPASYGKPDTQESQKRQYDYLKQHFFDDVDFRDVRLLRTPLIETKLDQYFKQIVVPIVDSINASVSRVIEMAKDEETMYQFVVQYLFNMYSNPEIMGTDAVYVFIADNYYLKGKTPWIDSTNLQGISYRVKELRPLLIGKVAPQLDGLFSIDEQPIDIKNIKSKFLILYFWSPDCGFCKEGVPKFHTQYKDLKKMDIEVIAINTRPDRESWVKFINDNSLSWINLYSPQKVRELIDKYQAFHTPILYILDNERHIIAKNISYEQIMPFFAQYLSMKQVGGATD